ncbi:unknown protein [Desulfotalea psychrophila LSv54]|uniref:Uncharacterized protein n=1 Tax=Desulfotalea psychrophila (strain LSv54 / DSM 12343) TaxID=177439 RepID=Q6AL83_DESPS|nr:unknown protein [Desulfotalea psychrophila LSv54]
MLLTGLCKGSLSNKVALAGSRKGCRSNKMVFAGSCKGCRSNKTAFAGSCKGCPLNKLAFAGLRKGVLLVLRISARCFISLGLCGLLQEGDRTELSTGEVGENRKEVNHREH